MEAAGIDPQRPYTYTNGVFIQEIKNKEELLENVLDESSSDVKHEISSTEVSELIESPKQEKILKSKKPAKKSTKSKEKVD